MEKRNEDVVRKEWVAKITDWAKAAGIDAEDILRVKSNEIAIPVVTEDGDEGYVKITIVVPKGSRDGEAYDGYAEAESYAIKVKEDEAKKAEAAKKKAAKIARDAATRAAKSNK